MSTQTLRISWKKRLSEFIKAEKRKQGKNNDEFADYLSKRSGETVSRGSISAWINMQSNELTPKSRRAIAGYRGQSVPEMLEWLEEGATTQPQTLSNTPSLSKIEDIEDIEEFISTAPASVAAHISRLANRRVLHFVGNGNGHNGASLRNHASHTTMQVRSSRSPMEEADSTLPSLISGFLQQLEQEVGLSRDEIADGLAVSRERLDALIRTRTDISDSEYEAIAKLLNRHFEEDDWTVKSLKASKDAWDRIAGKKKNGNGVS